jgi:putative DNA primase/helicase
MNAGNLLEAGRRLQRRHPDAVLIIAGDDDRQTEGNPGRTSAVQAAAALGCGLVLPEWPSRAPVTLSDFNDLRQWREAHA